MTNENTQWGVYSYKRSRKTKRTVSTMVAIFDTAPEARQLLAAWAGYGQVYSAPCDEHAKVTPAGKKKYTQHLQNVGVSHVKPDASWRYVSPRWNGPNSHARV